MKVVITGNFINSDEFAPYQRIMNLMTIIEENTHEKICLERISLNKFLPRFRNVLYYPLMFFIVSYQSLKSLKNIMNDEEVKFVYFYGRNLSMYLPVLLLCRFFKKKLMVDHVEHPLYLYRFSCLVSWRKLDQLLGYPFLWLFSDINIYISRSFEGSLFFERRFSVFVPVIILTAKIKIQKSMFSISNRKIKFLVISSLTERDNVSKLVQFIETSTDDVEFHIVGRFNNNTIMNHLSKLNNIILYNNATQDQKNKLLQIADCFVLFRNFSRAEMYSSPTRLAEFISYSKPVIVNDSSFVKQVVGNNSDGFFEWKDNDNFSVVVREILNIEPFDLNNYQFLINESMIKVNKLLAL